jgi:hypothetical protein
MEGQIFSFEILDMWLEEFESLSEFLMASEVAYMDEEVLRICGIDPLAKCFESFFEGW